MLGSNLFFIFAVSSLVFTPTKGVENVTDEQDVDEWFEAIRISGNRSQSHANFSTDSPNVKLMKFNSALFDKKDIQTALSATKLGTSAEAIEQVTNALNAVALIGSIRQDILNQEIHVNTVLTIGHALGQFVPVLNGFVTAIESIVSIFRHEPSLVEQLQPQFDLIQRRFDSIDRQLTVIADLISLNDYTVRRDRVMIDLSSRFKRMILNPSSDIAIEEFTQTCKTAGGLDLLAYTDDRVNLLTDFPKQQLDGILLLSRFKDTGVVILETSQLYTACLPFLYPQKTVAELESYSSTVSKPEIQNRISRIQAAFSAAWNAIRWSTDSEVMAQARSWVETYAENHGWPATSHEKFRNDVYYHLKPRYFWRDWLVGSYSGKTEGWNKHTVSYDPDNIVYRFRENGRSFFVALAYQGNRLRQDCLDMTFSKPLSKCTHLVDQIAACANRYYHVIYCVRTGNNLYALRDSARIGHSYRCPDEDCYDLFFVP